MIRLPGRKQPACPYCYYRIDPTATEFRCSGRPAPGKKPCTKAEDPTRVNAIGDSSPVLPSFKPPEGRGVQLGQRRSACPRCFGETGVRVCPACHSVLPASFGRGSPMFGVVGVKGSGKTVMLTVLAQELKTNVARRFDASITDVGTSALMEKMQGWRAQIGRGGKLPPSTPVYKPAETVPAVLEWRFARKRFGVSVPEATILSFYDAAGEDLVSSERVRDQYYLAAADGLILLLDPFGFPHNRELGTNRGIEETAVDPLGVLNSLTTMLREVDRLGHKKKVRRPLAIVVSKIDAFFDQLSPDHPFRRPAPAVAAFDETDAKDLNEHVAAVVYEWGGEGVLSHLRHNYADYRLFAASALGAEPDYRAEQANARGVLPHRVAEPLLWLMSTRGFVPKVES